MGRGTSQRRPKRKRPRHLPKVEGAAVVHWTEEERVASAYARWTPVNPWPRPQYVQSKDEAVKPARAPRTGLLIGSVALAIATTAFLVKVLS